MVWYMSLIQGSSSKTTTTQRPACLLLSSSPSRARLHNSVPAVPAESVQGKLSVCTQSGRSRMSFYRIPFQKSNVPTSPWSFLCSNPLALTMFSTLTFWISRQQIPSSGLLNCCTRWERWITRENWLDWEEGWQNSQWTPCCQRRSSTVRITSVHMKWARYRVPDFQLHWGKTKKNC